MKESRLMRHMNYIEKRHSHSFLGNDARIVFWYGHTAKNEGRITKRAA
jgi:hypothetical protein